MTAAPTDRHAATRAAEAILARDPLFAAHARFAFETLETLGQGGMGQVLRVRDKRCERQAALKLIRGEADIEARARFLREARITAQLDHPSIPPVYELGQTLDDTPYILMKIIEGQTLAQLIAEAEGVAPAEREAALQALIKVAEALAYAHSRGIVHRDVKPANIMVGRFGEVLLMDWGLAAARGEDEPAGAGFAADELAAEGLTVTGSVLGTPGYMAPEQARGEACERLAALNARVSSLKTLMMEAKARVKVGELEAGLALVARADALGAPALNQLPRIEAESLRGEYAAVESAANRYLELCPQLGEVLTARAVAQIQQGELAPAWQGLLGALAVAPDHDEALFWLAWLELRRRDYAAADRALSRLGEARAGAPDSLWIRAQVELGLGRDRQAREALQAFLARAPTHPEADRAREALRQLGEK